MQQSSATPKNQDVGRRLRKIVACSQSSSQCLLVNPRRACARVTVLGLCVCLCVSVCPAPRVLPLRATERPTEGTYGLGASWKTSGVFSLSKVMA